jgi:hypothetical protein
MAKSPCTRFYPTIRQLILWLWPTSYNHKDSIPDECETLYQFTRLSILFI